MKFFLSIVILVLSVIQIQAQDRNSYRIIRSNIGSSGSSQNITTAKGTYKISQSIGQGSVIGTHSSEGYYLRQGYQQPMIKFKALEVFDVSLGAKVFPNPFNQKITVSFTHKMLKNITVTVFDVNAKVIHSQIFLPAQKIHMKLRNIETGHYFLKVMSDKKRFNTKLIKI